jgi:aconitate hydratase
MKEQGLFRTKDSAEPVFTDSIELDLSTVEPSLAGPKRPQDRVALKAMKESFRSLSSLRSRTAASASAKTTSAAPRRWR